jgi:hypothetical protein
MSLDVQRKKAKSPCIGVCVIDPASTLCRGCLRRIDEIACWRDADEDLRQSILDRLALRRLGSPAAAPA